MDANINSFITSQYTYSSKPKDGWDVYLLLHPSLPGAPFACELLAVMFVAHGDLGAPIYLSPPPNFSPDLNKDP